MINFIKKLFYIKFYFNIFRKGQILLKYIHINTWKNLKYFKGRNIILRFNIGVAIVKNALISELRIAKCSEFT